MQHTPVESSILERVGYDADSNTLEVEFNEGATYRYFDVPESVYRGLLSVDSHGSFYADNVKHSFEFERVH